MVFREQIEKMKIVQINTVCGTGSTGRITTDIHNLLVKKGYDSLVVFGRGKPLRCNNYIKVSSKLDMYFHALMTRIFDFHGLGSLFSTFKLIRSLNSIKPDLIHMHNIHGYYLNYFVLFFYIKNRKIPVVWTLHDCWPITGHCAYFSYVNCSKWTKICKKCPQKHSYPSNYLFSNAQINFRVKKHLFSSLHNMTVVTPSTWLGEISRQSFLKKYNTITINNGVDLDIFKFKKNDLKERYCILDKKVILGVANPWTERKGLVYFLELSKIVPENYMIVLIGLSKQQIVELPNNIIKLSRTNSAEELAEYYSAADVFANPTLEDNFPTTNIESLACGTPVVTFQTGGSPEILDENTGHICKEKNAESLLEGINLILNESKDFKKNCRLRAVKFYNKDERFNDYINLYKTILKGVK